MKQPHKLARIEVDVYRLFKIKDIGRALSCAADPVVADLGEQASEQADQMVKPYEEEQRHLIELAEKRSSRKTKRQPSKRRRR